MKKEAKKNTSKNTEKALLNLLKQVLPKATEDPALAEKIFDAIQRELELRTRTTAFQKFCQRVELPDLEKESIEEVKKQFSAAFGDADVTVKPNRKDHTLAVEVDMPDGGQFSTEIAVGAKPDELPEDDDAPAPKFTPFPVCLPGDRELVWVLGRHDNLSPEEAGMALTRVEEAFWGSKTGQKLLRDRVEKSFPEFIGRVPPAMLSEAGLKRHYKEPEVLKVLQQLRKKTG